MLAEETLADRIRRELEEAEVVAAGFAPLTPTWFDARRADLQVARGEAIDGHFTFRRPTASAVLRRRVPWAAWHLTVAIGYDLRVDDGSPQVAGYATEDRYGQLRGVLDRAKEVVCSAGARALVVADSNLAFDKALARRAGIGVVGRHTLILVPGWGARVLIGSLVSDVRIPVRFGRRFARHPCGSCLRCLAACPVGALVAPGVLDAKRCLSATLQEPELSRQDRAHVGTRVYGCDDCLRACPVGARHTDPIPAPSPRWLLEAPDDTVRATVGHWYLPRRDPFFARRNLLIAVANSGSEEARRTLARAWFAPDPRLRREAVRNWFRLGGRPPRLRVPAPHSRPACATP